MPLLDEPLFEPRLVVVAEPVALRVVADPAALRGVAERVPLDVPGRVYPVPRTTFPPADGVVGRITTVPIGATPGQ